MPRLLKRSGRAAVSLFVADASPGQGAGRRPQMTDTNRRRVQRKGHRATYFFSRLSTIIVFPESSPLANLVARWSGSFSDQQIFRVSPSNS